MIALGWIAALWGFSALFVAASLSFGLLLVDRAFRLAALPALERAVLGLAAGVAAFALALYAAGFLHAFGPAVAILLPAAFLAAGAPHAIRSIRPVLRAPRPPRPGPLAAICTAFGALGIALVYLGALTPDAINFDASFLHLPIAADYARLGGIVPFDNDYVRSVPHLGSVLYTWAFLVPGLDQPLRWMLAQHLEIALFLGTLPGIAALTRWLLVRDESDAPPRGTWAAFFLFPAIFVYDSNLGASADHVLAFFAAPLFLVAMRAARTLEPRTGALAGLLAGAALLTKYQAVELFAGLLAVLAALAALRARADRSLRRSLSALTAASLAFVVVAAPHFLANAVHHRNPVYPFAQDVFLGSTPSLPSGPFLFEHLFKPANGRPPAALGTRFFSSLRLVLTYSFEPHYVFSRGLPASGSLFTLGLFLLPFLRDARRLRIAAAAGCVTLFAWAMTLRVDRNLQTFLPLLVAVTAALLVRAWELGPRARFVVVPLVALQLVASGAAAYTSRERLRSAIELLAGRRAIAGSRSDFQALGASLPARARVLMHIYRPNLGIDRDVVFDLAGQQGLLSYDGAEDARDLYERWRAAGVTHVVDRPGYRPALTRQEEVLFADYVARCEGCVRPFGALSLVTLPPEPPPRRAPFHVLALGLPGYENGLYLAASMNVIEQLDEPLRHYPDPVEPYRSDPAASLRLVDRASAVLVGRRRSLSNEVSAALDRGFFVARSFDELTVYLRR